MKGERSDRSAHGAAPGCAAVQQVLDQLVTDGAPASYASVVLGGDLWQGTSGIGDVQTGAEPDPYGQFRVGSVTKSFVASTVLHLDAERRLKLDDSAADHLPGLLPYPEPITIRQLLQHTSGLPAGFNHWADPEKIDDLRWRRFEPAELVRLGTANQALLFPPGTGWSYSTVGYVTLGMLIEKVTGNELGTELTQRILRPLRLPGTYFPKHFPYVNRPGAHGYESLYGPEGGLVDLTTYVMSKVWSSGNLVSTGQDINTFYRALLRGELLPDEQLNEMLRTVPTRGELGEFEYGLGIMSRTSPCDGRTWWGHSGDLPGYATWSLHTGDADRQMTAGITRNLTATKEAALGLAEQLPRVALCTVR